MNNKNGGPAFPDSDGQTDYTGGMTLRDYFAAKAMQAMINNYVEYGYDGYADLANDAYKLADAMLAEREKVNEGN